MGLKVFKPLQRVTLAVFILLVLVASSPIIALDLAPNGGNFNALAHFKVTSDIVNKDVSAFTATIGGVGNSVFDQPSAFEPIIYRNKYRATEDAHDRIVTSENALSHFNTFREGFLDGADVRVYRIVNGKFKLVREDKVAEGGFHVSGWTRAMRNDAVLAPATTRFVYRWDGYNRPQVKYYFTVKAVSRSGKLSAPAQVIAIERPENTGKGAPSNTLVDFKPSKFLIDYSTPPVPDNLRGNIAADGALHLEWSPVSAGDLAGYVVYISDYPPDKHAGHYMQLTRTAASLEQRIKTGDMVIVSKKFYKTSRKQQLSNRVWNAFGEYSVLLPGLVDFFPDENEGVSWELARHGSSNAVEDPGETYLKLDLAARARETIGAFNHSGTGQSFYQVLEKRTYKVEVWLRRESGSGTVRFRLLPFYARQIEPIVFDVGPNWQKFVATFTPEETMSGEQANRMHLEFIGPGTFNIDNFRVYRADAEYLDYTPRLYSELKASRMQALRTHGFIKTGFRTYDAQQITNTAGIAGGRSRGSKNTLPQIFKLM